MPEVSPPGRTAAIPSAGKKRSADQLDSIPKHTDDGAASLQADASNAGSDTTICRVPGCTSAVTEETLRNSHRVKLCVFHQKAESVEVAGVPNRFCQQCTRLHPLDMFDGEKRGCRKRLERHNRRRQRKAKVVKLQGGGTLSNSDYTDTTGMQSYFSAPVGTASCSREWGGPIAPTVARQNSSVQSRSRMDRLLALQSSSSLTSGHTHVSSMGSAVARPSANDSFTGSFRETIPRQFSATNSQPKQLNIQPEVDASHGNNRHWNEAHHTSHYNNYSNSYMANQAGNDNGYHSQEFPGGPDYMHQSKFADMYGSDIIGHMLGNSDSMYHMAQWRQNNEETYGVHQPSVWPGATRPF